MAHKKTQLYIALLALACIAIHIFLRFTIPLAAPYPLYVSLAIGGALLLYDLLLKLITFEFGADLLAGMSIITSIILGEYLAGSLVVLMLAGGEALENYALKKASRVLESLAKRVPSTAHRKNQEQIEEIPIGNIDVGDILYLFPHEISPVDGTVTEGNGVMDESFLTGEPFLIAKAPGSEILSGSINGDASLTFQATKKAVDSRYAKIMRVLMATEQKRPRMRRLADQLGAWYTPFALLIALTAWYTSGEALRFLAVLVIATPCPLLIAIPVAIIGSISLCASRGILIKNPIVLEQLDQCQTMIFDKTGTLTYGRPSLSEQTLYGGVDPKEALTLAASLERYSKHPLAKAILDKAQEEKISLKEAQTISEPKGEGLQGIVDGRHVMITSRKKLTDPHIALPEGHGLECILLIEHQLAAHYRFHDAPRKESSAFVKHLFPKHGFKKIMIVSGDRKEEVEYLAKHIGITEIYAQKTPEEKVDIVQAETLLTKTAYLGDGINDAPALVAATVGIAFGQNSDITVESAGAVVMDSSLEKVDEFLHISHRMRKIALQSAWGGMTLSFIGMLIAAFGYLPPVAGAISQEIIDVIVILNALRTIWQPNILTDIS